MNYQDYLKNKKPYQEAGHIFLLERKHACLYYKPGKGKTYPCIEAISDINKQKGGRAKVLILSTPDAIKNMWKVDICPQGILPMNAELYTFNSAVVDTRKTYLTSIKWDIIVIDECHKIKAHNTKISKLVFLLTKKCEYVFGLSGTPRGNSDVDIFCQFHNMHISDWGEISYTYFTQNCCVCEEQYFNGHMILKPVAIADKYRDGWERNIAYYTQRVDYDEDDNMPQLIVNDFRVPYKITKEYTQAEQGVISIPDFETTLTKLTAINKLHQIANGYVYTDGGVYHINDNFKLEVLQELVKYKDCVTIVYKFIEDLSDIKLALGEENCTELIDVFKSGKKKYLLLQCSRCESFNLQMCNNIIFYTMDYSYIYYNQMLHRLWRMGQQNDVTVTVLVNADTIEEKIWRVVKNKESLSELFFAIKGI